MHKRHVSLVIALLVGSTPYPIFHGYGSPWSVELGCQRNVLQLDVKNDQTHAVRVATADLVDAPSWLHFHNGADTLFSSLGSGQTWKPRFLFDAAADAPADQDDEVVISLRIVYGPERIVLEERRLKLKIVSRTGTTRLQNFPNPFSGTTELAFYLPSPCWASLKVYDSAGKLVAILLDKSATRGYCALAWDGRDEYDNRVGSGVYFCRLVADDFTATRKMIVLR